MTTHRGTTNRNDRGNTEDRRRRREWLVATYRADVDAVLVSGQLLAFPRVKGISHPDQQPACRCYRCGELLTEDTVTVDRIIPGCQGGTYRRSNIRPSCAGCNSETGAELGNARRAAKRPRELVAV